ncbi:MAG: STAS-like domain-containing protein [Nitrospira sp.]|nr:STAS-like domain-containing protein [Nitrospira sp.]
MVFNVKDTAQRDTGSRQGGKRIRGMIENLLRERRPVNIDFDGVGVISSSFADEVFGRLFVEMGPYDFMTRIKICNADPTVKGLIDRAIMQRTRLGNGDA